MMTKTTVNHWNGKQLLAANRHMLGQGAPDIEDGQGYNKLDYNFMKSINERYNEMLPAETAYRVAKTLERYKNTQLSEYKERIEASVEFYKKYKDTNTLIIQKHTPKEVHATWKYNAELKNAMRKLPSTYYKWTKENNVWVCKLQVAYLEELRKLLEDYGVECSALDTLDLPEQGTTENTPPPKPEIIKVNVKRKDEDSLIVKFEYDRNLVDAIKTSRTSYFHSANKEWRIDINDAPAVYQAMEKIEHADASKLKYWSDLMKHDSNYTFNTDLSHVPFTPRPYQIEDAKEMLKHKRLLNANEMGVGKTFECVIAGESIPKPKLVICPATLRMNWAKEIRMVNPDADIAILHNSDDFSYGKDWTIIGYPSLDSHIKNLEKVGFGMLVSDEAHYVKAINNAGKPTSKRGRLTLHLAKTIEYVFPVTGTPKTNRNKDLFNILKMVNHPLTQGKWSFMNFGKTYCDGNKTRWGWDFEGSSNDETLHDSIKNNMVRHLKSEVLPHITKMRSSLPVEVDLKGYHAAIEEYIEKMESDDGEQLVRLTKAKQILANNKASETAGFAKDILDQGEKVVIVTAFTGVVKKMEKELSKYNLIKIVGGMSDTAKNQALEDFQDGNAQVCIMNIVAGGVGITLTAAHHLIFNDMDFVPANMLQAEDRIARSGQTEVSMIYYMYAQGAEMDEWLADLYHHKLETINNAIDGGKGEQVNVKQLLEEHMAAHTGHPVIKKSQKPQPEVPTTEIVEIRTIEDVKELSYPELVYFAEKIGAEWKKSPHKGIDRMRITMALKKAL